jgi:hypothetical protein
VSTSKNILKKLTSAVLVAGLLVAAQAPIASAASNYWTAAGDGETWNNTPNWSLGRAPINNDVVVFNSANSTEEYIVNDKTNLRLSGITFTGNSSNGHIIYGNTIQMAGEIRDQNTGNAVNYLSNNILSTGTLKIATVNNAWLFTDGKYTINNHALYFRAYHNSMNYFDGTVVGTTGSVYVVGDNSGLTAFGFNSNVLRPTIVKDKGKFWPGGKMSNLLVTASGYMHNEVCSYTRNLRIEGYHYVHINGDPVCSKYGRINATGTVNITNGKLAFTNDAISGSYKPIIGAKYVLVSNDGSDKVIGTYKNRPEGSVVKIGVRNFKITYKGGTGNDIVLTRLP